jgi:CheY-like chemotaxis protein
MTENQKIIFIVDDDKFLLDMYSVKFVQAGYGVVGCSSGKDALKRLREGATPVAIILDLIMPEIDGFELLKTISEEKLGGENMVRIVLSNQGQEEERRKAEVFGIDGYIIKAHAIPTEVLEAVEAICEKKLKR